MQLMFETFNISGFYASEQAVLSLYAVGRISGCTVDIGHGKIGTHTTSVQTFTKARGLYFDNIFINFVEFISLLFSTSSFAYVYPNSFSTIYKQGIDLFLRFKDIKIEIIH